MKWSVDVGFKWTRALRAEVSTPEGKVALYVAHLASVRVGTSGFTSDQRNDTIKALGRQIADEKLAGVIVMGDFNGTANDRSLAPLTAGLRSAQGAAGQGFSSPGRPSSRWPGSTTSWCAGSPRPRRG